MGHYEKNVVRIADQPMLSAMEDCAVHINDGCVVRVNIPLYGRIKRTNIFDSLFGSNDGLLKGILSVNWHNTVVIVSLPSVALSSTGCTNHHRHCIHPWHSVLVQLSMGHSLRVVKGFWLS
jgi:hypothetical protein